jgi:hypothetical protein
VEGGEWMYTELEGAHIHPHPPALLSLEVVEGLGDFYTQAYDRQRHHHHL